MIGTFPAIQLLYTAIRQLSRPISNHMRNKAITNRVFREYVCIPLAQFYNVCDVRMRFRILDLKKPKHIRPLTPAQALDIGAELFTELMVFFICASTIVMEYLRQKFKAKHKKMEEEMEMAELISKINLFHEIIDDHSKQLAIIQSEIESLKTNNNNNSSNTKYITKNK